MSATPMNNKDYLWSPKAEALAKLRHAREQKGIKYEDLAQRLGVTKIWLASAFDGQQWVPQDLAQKIAQELGVSQQEVAVLQEHPYKGNVDPILYRLHEVFDTYGPALKEVIHEKFGNGIMSAIDFSIDVEKRDDPGGERIIITFDGKFLPYSFAGNYPW